MATHSTREEVDDNHHCPKRKDWIKKWQNQSKPE